MKMKEELINVPIQVMHLIDCLKDKNERVHIRGNYRNRLDDIRKAVDKAILEYDQEMSQSSRFRTGQR
jgi:ADP-dependent phosphofructokinase/glucokinase